MKFLLVLLLPLLSFAQEAKWSNQSEASIIQTGGNTNLETYNLKSDVSRQMEKRIYSAGGHYTLGTSKTTDDNGDEVKTETARNWDARLKYEQELSKHSNGYVGVQYEGNEFSGYTQRDNYDIGGKYKVHEGDDFNSFFELGYRHTIERTTTRDKNGDDIFIDEKARFYYELNHVAKEGLTYRFWTEYIKNFTRTEDYLINFEPSMSFTINSMFSIKLAYKGMYDNEPAIEGNKYLDWTYTTSLIAVF